MKKAIFYKEWIKTHRYFWLALIVSSVFVIYALLQLQRVASKEWNTCGKYYFRARRSLSNC